MKRFLKCIVLFFGAPLVVLLGLYLWTDPFKCLHQFDINNVDNTNREYLSTELFLRNEKSQHYNSFIFSSSRGCGMNTYRWKNYLSPDAHPFIFQAWSETLTGIEMKMSYLDEHQVPLDHVLIMLDIPGAFKKEQLSCEAMTMKHFLFTGKSRISYNAAQYFNFIQKPSLWWSSIKKRVVGSKEFCHSDTITNDWNKDNKYSCTGIPEQDSLRDCSEMSRQTFFAKIAHRKNEGIAVSEPLISKSFEDQLRHIKTILDGNKSDYYVILSPAYCYMNPAVNPEDLEKLKVVFGEDRVYDFTGKNEMTDDYNNFTDPNHFGQRVGWMILETLYGAKEKGANDLSISIQY